MGTINIYSGNGANKAGLTYNGSGDITVDTEHLANTSSSIQSQLDAKLPSAGGTLTGTLVVNTAGNSLPSVSLSHSNTNADNFMLTGGVPGTSNAGFSIRDVDASANRLVIDSSGRVGIGTSSPVSTLDVSSTAGLGSVFRKDFNGPVADTFSKVAVTLWGQDHDDADVGTGTDQFGPMLGFGARIDDGAPNTGDIRAGISYSYNGDLTFHAKAGASVADGSYERIRIDGATGNVGIGLTSNFGSKLHVNSEMSLGPDNNNRIIIGSTSGGVGSIGTIEGGTASFSTMTFKGGKVGIGTGSPDAKLSINADALDQPALVLGNVDGGGIAYVHRQSRYLLSNGSNWIGDGKDPIAVIGTNSSSTNKFPSAGLVMHNESQTDNTFSTPIVFGNKSNSGAYNTAYAYVAGRKVGQGVDSNWSTGELWIDTAGRKHNGNDEYMDHSPAIKVRQTGTVDMRWQPFSYGPLSGNGASTANGTGWAFSPITTQGLSYNTNAAHGPGFTVVEAGYYQCFATGLYAPGGGLSYVYIGWCINGAQIHHWHSNHSIASNHDFVSSIIRWCNAGDHITLENSSATVTSQWGGQHSQYHIWKLG